MTDKNFVLPKNIPTRSKIVLPKNIPTRSKIVLPKNIPTRSKIVLPKNITTYSKSVLPKIIQNEPLNNEPLNNEPLNNEPLNKEENIKSHYCYILRNRHEPDINRTYNGYTVTPKKRIRQHNQEITGGAKYTKAWGNKSWEIYVLIKGFPDHHNATQCEWKIKHPARSRIRPARYNNPKCRIIGLNEVLKTDRWTGNSTIDNKDITLKIWIVEEYAHLLSDVPKNIEVISVPIIDLEDI